MYTLANAESFMTLFTVHVKKYFSQFSKVHTTRCRCVLHLVFVAQMDEAILEVVNTNIYLCWKS